MTRTLTLLYNPANLVEKHSFWQSETPFSKGPYTVTAGKTFGDAELNRINKGTTTRAELIGWFGPPTVESFNVEGDPVLSWYHIHMRDGWTRKFHLQRFSVLLDPAGVVKDFAVGANFGLEGASQ